MDEMNIIVCVKKIPDPEIPPAKFKLDKESKSVVPPEGIPPVMNPYDEQAVELALRLKEKHGGTIRVLSIDNEADATIIKHALAMGADEGYVLSDEIFTDLDSFSTAHILGQAIKKLENFDLVLCGRQAADWDEGLSGSILAENLNLPLVTLAEALECTEDKFEVKKVILDGFQLYTTSIPAVVTVSSRVGQPRLPSGWGIISASRAQVPIWNAADIDMDPSQLNKATHQRGLVELYIPRQERKCEFIKGKTPEDTAALMAEKLIKARSI